MRDVDLFQQALGLVAPWGVVESCFDAGQRRLDLRIDFELGRDVRLPGVRSRRLFGGTTRA